MSAFVLLAALCIGIRRALEHIADLQREARLQHWQPTPRPTHRSHRT